MQDWAAAVSRRAWSKKVFEESPKKMEQLCVDDEDEPACWFVGLRGGFYYLKGYLKIKSS
jgi:hypothetical protein